MLATALSDMQLAPSSKSLGQCDSAVEASKVMTIQNSRSKKEHNGHDDPSDSIILNWRSMDEHQEHHDEEDPVDSSDDENSKSKSIANGPICLTAGVGSGVFTQPKTQTNPKPLPWCYLKWWFHSSNLLHRQTLAYAPLPG